MQDPEGRVGGGPPVGSELTEDRRGDVLAPVAPHKFLRKSSAPEPRTLGLGDFQGSQVVLLEARRPLPELVVQGLGLPSLIGGAGSQVAGDQPRSPERGALGDLPPQSLLIRV